MESNPLPWPVGLPVPLIDRQHALHSRGIVTRMESGRSRHRRDMLAPVHVIDATWNFTQEQYLTFKGFFEVDLVNGEDIFTFVTYDPVSDPSKVRATTWVLAFLNGTYSLSHADGLYQITAELEVDAEEFAEVENPFYIDTNPPTPPPELPDVEIVYDEPCMEEFTLSWDYAEDDEVQTATSEEGPWYQYIVPDLTPAEQALPVPTKTVRINNQFYGERWFRVATSAGVAKTKAARPLASLVDPPEISLAGVTDNIRGMDTCPLALGFVGSTDEGIYKPVSYIENRLINPELYYLEPVGRKIFTYVERTASSLYTPSVLTIVTEHEPNSTRWTRDGSDPDATTQNPKFGDTLNHAQVLKDDFACIIKARCFSGDCKSPLIVLLVDKELDNTAMVRISLETAFANRMCYQSAVIGEEEWEVSPGSCKLDWGGDPTGHHMVLSVQSSICNGVIPWSYLTTLNRIIAYSKEVEQYGVGTESPLFTGTKYSFGLQRYFTLLPQRVSAWNHRPKLYEYVRFITSEEAEPMYDIISGCAGTGGSFAQAIALTDLTCWQLARMSCPPSNTMTLDYWAIVISRYKDFESDESNYIDPPEEEIPDPPQPPLENEYFDFFEDYDDTDTAESSVLNFGEGWDDEWTLIDAEPPEGLDYFEDYALEDGEILFDELDFEFPYGGEGWEGEWHFFSDEDEFNYGDDFESYADGPLGVANDGGTGWALLFPTDPYLTDIVESWYSTNKPNGLDDFESYADQVIAATEPGLAYADGTWEGSHGWWFNGY